MKYVVRMGTRGSSSLRMFAPRRADTKGNIVTSRYLPSDFAILRSVTSRFRGEGAEIFWRGQCWKMGWPCCIGHVSLLVCPRLALRFPLVPLVVNFYSNHLRTLAAARRGLRALPSWPGKGKI